MNVSGIRTPELRGSKYGNNTQCIILTRLLKSILNTNIAITNHRLITFFRPPSPSTRYSPWPRWPPPSSTPPPSHSCRRRTGKPSLLRWFLLQRPKGRGRRGRSKRWSRELKTDLLETFFLCQLDVATSIFKNRFPMYFFPRSSASLKLSLFRNV